MLVDDAHVLAMPGQLERRRETGRPGPDHEDRQLRPGRHRHTMRSRMAPASVCPGARTGSMQKKSWPGGT
jgi:hypothetical protein